ncbi:RNA-binding protein 28 [Diorhabda carinulata]|uniref:RNA-binding protein 28 n=1 Tax=Diorhabda carinulata TaxID=1163345 RepID=UPI0025A0FBC6|nr:RNA-binding protein 28 [Diorhabda carinulata]
MDGIRVEGKKKKKLTKEEVKIRLRERKKEAARLLKEKRARLVVKNLSFKVTPEKLKEHFEKYGEVKSVDLLKNSDGKLKGCAFIQFDLVQKAAKARHHTNDTNFLGRKISVDFAKPKNKYIKEKKSVEIKNEDGTTEIIEIKDEVSEDNIPEENDDKKVIKSESDTETSANSENEDLVDEREKDSDDESEDNLGDESEDNLDDESEEKKVPKHNTNKPHIISHDVNEGKTVFIKNVPFDANNNDLRQCMMQFGPVYYALICVDKLTEHSKGTAFVKFVNKEDAEKALNAGTELKLLGNILDCHQAIDRDDINKNIKNKKENKMQPKDSRNLYLVKEGVILAGHKAAEGVSAADMAKRLQIEQYKTQMLRNLNMFVSKERLVVHNLPPSWDDKKLKTLFQKYGGPGAVIREARIMRDMKIIDANGVGKSKEYGFVTFTKHENALAALRNLNNNPEIFSEHKRPIITFSIENKSIIKAREKRLEKSKQYNPLSKSFKPEGNEKIFKRNGKISRKTFDKNKKPNTSQLEDDLPKFGGVTAKPGTKDKLRSRYKLVNQAKLHHENLKKEKKRKKTAKKSLAEKRKEFIKQPKHKMNHVVVKDNFSKLVSNYKKILTNANVGKKSKWYEES